VIVDLHTHYPMHLLGPGESTHAAITSRQWRAHIRARLVDLISRFANYQGPGGLPGVTVDLLNQGGVGVALSVLYCPFTEIDLTKRYASPPEASYFRDLMDQLELVEAELATMPAEATVARDLAELDGALASETLALVHCVEGGVQLGPLDVVEANVETLAKRGVAYVTLAHLFWRKVATNAPALPFLPDWLYRLLFPQPHGTGLTDIGRAALTAMVRHQVMVDITHMSAHSLSDTFELLDELDPDRKRPVIASHIACRFGHLDYNLTDETVARVADRGGALGVIACEHYLTDGVRKERTTTFDESVDVVCAHIDRIAEITGSHGHAALGSDMDGYIKPTVKGLEHAGRLSDLEAALVKRYGAETAGKVCSGNALRVLRSNWGA
jgi:microsomal dipeptidase-like Zn-dependent dipeptidase